MFVHAQPLIVRVTLIDENKGAPDEKEKYVGILVNSQGDFVDAPSPGSPLYLSGNPKGGTLDFKTPPVSYIEVHDTFWLVETEGGAYAVEHGRLLN